MNWAVLLANVGVVLCGMAAVGNVMLSSVIWKRLKRLEARR